MTMESTLIMTFTSTWTRYPSIPLRHILATLVHIAAPLQSIARFSLQTVYSDLQPVLENKIRFYCGLCEDLTEED